MALTATLSPYSQSGYSTNGETVGFYNNVGLVGNETATLLGTGTLSNGIATFTIADLASDEYYGIYNFSAKYGGDADFAAATSNQLMVSATPVPTTMSLTISPSAPAVGQIVTFTATLSPYAQGSDNTNGEYVMFLGPTGNLGSNVLNNGTTSFTWTTPVSAGPVQWTAFYGGDNLFASSSKTLSMQIVQPTTLALSTNPNPSNYGAPVTLTAMLTPYSTSTISSDGGVVTFMNGNTALGKGTLASGMAQLVTQSLPGGTDSLTAVFAGHNDFGGSTSAPVAQAVTQATPSIALSASDTAVYATTTVTFVATVSSAAGAPTGTVSFYDGTTMLGSGTLSSGTASYATSALAAGPHSITAAYGGDVDFTAVTSSAVGVAVVGSFSIAAQSGGSTSATASPGGQATYMLSLSPPAGETFPSAVTFSIAGLPAGATATFLPATVPAGSGATNVTLTIKLPASAANRFAGRSFGGGDLAVALGLLLLPFAGICKGRRRLNRVAWLAVLAMTGAAMAITLSSCGGSSGGGSGQQQQQPQNYTLTVTAASGAVSNPITLTLTVE